MMFKILALQTLYSLSDEQTEFQVSNRLSFMRFLGVTLSDSAPNRTMVWLFREALIKAGTMEGLSGDGRSDHRSPAPASDPGGKAEPAQWRRSALTISQKTVEGHRSPLDHEARLGKGQNRRGIGNGSENEWIPKIFPKSRKINLNVLIYAIKPVLKRVLRGFPSFSVRLFLFSLKSCLKSDH